MTNRASFSRLWLRRGVWVGAVVLLVAAIGVFFALDGLKAEKSVYRFVKISRGDIESIVSASGSVQPVVTVQVGSQISGKIAELLADFNAPVKKGQVIARLDAANFEARVWQSEADLNVAHANVGMQEASLLAMRAEVDGARSNLKDAAQDYDRKKALLSRRVVAQSVVDKALAVKEQATAKLRGTEAKLRMQEAQVRHARASVDEKRAQLKQRQLDLSYTVIRSPVDGVVISRDVDVGQTVAASLQAPTLFTIARDLRNMQVEVSVDEADIGQVKEGQRVVFTVDSFPEREYAGRVTQIRKAPTEESSVVTYTVIVDAANTDFSLLPGMTATVSLIVGARENVLRVENAALRFRPPDAAAREQVAGTGRNDGSRLDRRLERMAKALALTDAQRGDIRVIIAAVADRTRAMRAQGGEPEEIRTALQALRENSRKQIEPLLSAEQRKKYRNFVRQREQHPTRRGELWTLNGAGELMPVRVTLGISDGSVTELVRTDLEVGAAVVVGRLKAPESPRRGLRFGF